MALWVWIWPDGGRSHHLDSFKAAVMKRRYFFKALTSGLLLVQASVPALFLPRIIQAHWKRPRPAAVIDPSGKLSRIENTGTETVELFNAQGNGIILIEPGWVVHLPLHAGANLKARTLSGNPCDLTIWSMEL